MVNAMTSGTDLVTGHIRLTCALLAALRAGGEPADQAVRNYSDNLFQDLGTPETAAAPEGDPDVVALLCSSRILLQRALAKPMKPQTKRSIAGIITAINLAVYFQEQPETKTETNP